MRAAIDRVLMPVIRFLHDTLGLSPDQVSFAGLLVGLAAAGTVAAGRIAGGLLLMAIAQVMDALDGGIARRYNIQSPHGARMETICDRISELAMFLALTIAGEVTAGMAALAFAAILLVSAIEPRSHFDPGFKRFTLYFGWVAQMVFPCRGFQLAMHVIFLANLSAFAIGTVLLDYRLQKETDAEEIRHRAQLRATGVPLPPEDRPTILSRIASWF